MSEVTERLKRQSQWQKNRASLPWPEKVRMAEEMRRDLETLRRRDPTVVRRTDGEDRRGRGELLNAHRS